MAECHPVGFQWVMEAKARGATIIHVDPRFTRTSAVADLHVPIRAGTDIAFLGALVNHVLSNELYFRDYVVAYTNAAAIVDEEFEDTEDLDGVFSGLDREKGKYESDVLAVRGCRGVGGGGSARPEPARDAVVGGTSDGSGGSRRAVARRDPRGGPLGDGRLRRSGGRGQARPGRDRCSTRGA